MGKVRKFLFSQEYDSAVWMARVAATMATFLWACVILLSKDALVVTAYWWVTLYLHQNTIALPYFAITLFNILLLFDKLPILHRNWYHHTAYGAISALWSLIWFSVILREGPLQVTAFSTVTVIAALSLYGFMANPTHERNDHGTQLRT